MGKEIPSPQRDLWQFWWCAGCRDTRFGGAAPEELLRSGSGCLFQKGALPPTPDLHFVPLYTLESTNVFTRMLVLLSIIIMNDTNAL